MNKIEKGQELDAIVTSIEKYGVFVKIDNENSGLIHISEVAKNYIRDLNDYFKINDKIKVRVINVDIDQKRINLSTKEFFGGDKKAMANRKIIETELGFKTLAKKLPIWIDKKLKNK